MNRVRKQRHSGFTIVELLVVIVVIAILAAITLVTYGSVSSRAISAALQSDLANASTQLKAFEVDNGSYPSTTSTDCSTNPTTTTPPTNLCLKLSPGNTLIGYSASNTTSNKSFTLIAGSSPTVSSNSQTYKVTKTLPHLAKYLTPCNQASHQALS